MKKSIKIGLLTLLLSFSAVFYATSQVTIGTIEQPLEGTLLDLKESTVLNGGANSQKGLMLPRVTLTKLNSLYPILSGGDENNQVLKPNYTGLIVYNVSTTTPFVKGLYSWDGTKWNLLSPISADSGLNLTNDTIKLGGALTQPTNINLNNYDLVVSTNSGTTTFDHSNGDLLIRSTQNKVKVGRVDTGGDTQKDTLHIKGRINLDEPEFSTETHDHYLVLDSTGTIRCRPSTVSRISELGKGKTTDWSKADPDSINDFYFVDKAHILTLPLIDGSGIGEISGGTIAKFRGRIIRFYIYGGPGEEGSMYGVTFKGVAVPSLWSIPSIIQNFFSYYQYNGTSALSLPIPDGIVGMLRIYDGGATTTSPLSSKYPDSRFRFIDIICDGKRWWVNNM